MSSVHSNVVRLELMDKEMRQSAVCKDWFAGTDEAVIFLSLHCTIVCDTRCILIDLASIWRSQWQVI